MINSVEYGVTATVNSGNVTKQTITVPGLAQPFIQNYTYDELNRLKTATETNNGSQTWTQVYGIDRYGNRNITSGMGVTNLTFNAANNRITTAGYSFDVAGNTTADPSGKTFTYDAENKQTLVNGGSVGQYFYDGDGKRVRKYVPSTGDTTVFVYDAGGKLVAEYSTIVYPSTTAKLAYVTNDHLGSPRINTDANGAVTSRHDYHPYGEEVLTAQRTTGLNYAADDIRKQFTGYERDIESGLDFAEARMYISGLGRFSAVDPLAASASPADPQTFNRYIYVRNSPLIMIDPTGMVMDDWYIRNDGDISVRRTNDSSDRFFVFDENQGSFSQVAQLEKNSSGLVQFPDSGYGFTRYGKSDEGGNDPVHGENVGSGDHFLKPEVAASLFGLSNQLRNQFGVTIALGDMSSSNGSDPWSPALAGGANNGHHVGHGHLGNRMGLDIDFRYIGNDGQSKHGNFEILSVGNPNGNNRSVSTGGFSSEKTQAVFDTGSRFGFQQNFHDVVRKEVGYGRTTSIGFRNATQYDGHKDHGHLGYVPGSVRIRTLR